MNLTFSSYAILRIYIKTYVWYTIWKIPFFLEPHSPPPPWVLTALSPSWQVTSQIYRTYININHRSITKNLSGRNPLLSSWYSVSLWEKKIGCCCVAGWITRVMTPLSVRLPPSQRKQGFFTNSYTLISKISQGWHLFTEMVTVNLVYH